MFEHELCSEYGALLTDFDARPRCYASATDRDGQINLRDRVSLLRWADGTFVTEYCGVCVCVCVGVGATNCDDRRMNCN